MKNAFAIIVSTLVLMVIFSQAIMVFSNFEDIVKLEKRFTEVQATQNQLIERA